MKLTAEQRMKNLRLDLKLANQENDNLRHLLAWAGARLGDADKTVLSKLLDRQICEGGAVEDTREEERADYKEVVRLLGECAKMFDEAISSSRALPMRWYWKAERISSFARHHEPKSKEATLHEIRNIKQIMRQEARAR